MIDVELEVVLEPGWWETATPEDARVLYDRVRTVGPGHPSYCTVCDALEDGADRLWDVRLDREWDDWRTAEGLSLTPWRDRVAV